MFKLNLKIALRNLLSNKVYAAINIGGLAIGLTSCLLLMFYATYEWGYDRQFKNSPHIYQAMINLKDQNGTVMRTIDQSQNVLLAALKEEFPDVLYGTRITDVYKRLIANGQEHLKLNSRYVDPDFLRLFIYRQIQFVKNIPLGYKSTGLLEIPHEGLLYEKFDLLKSRLLSSGAVLGVAQSSGSISNKNSSVRGLGWNGMTESDKMIDFDQIYTRYDFVKTTNITLLGGRDFNQKFASDTAALLLSKKAVEVMHLKNPIGARVLYQGEKRNVVGVFDDIVWADRSRRAAPMVIAYADISDVITMRLNPAKSLSESIDVINKQLKELNPDFPVDIKFVDSLNEVKLKNERILGTLANLFGCLAIFISCLGLFGLSAFSMSQRIKEISIRKILGASVAELMVLLSFSYMKLIGIAIVISVPVAYYIMNNWLQRFELRTSLNLWMFALTAVLTLLISVLTISWQTFRAVKTNAVDALKYE